MVKYLFAVRRNYISRIMSSKRPGFLPRILTIATNSFREAVRDRILYNLIVFVLLVACADLVSTFLRKRLG